MLPVESFDGIVIVNYESPLFLFDQLKTIISCKKLNWRCSKTTRKNVKLKFFNGKEGPPNGTGADFSENSIEQKSLGKATATSTKKRKLSVKSIYQELAIGIKKVCCNHPTPHYLL